MRVREWRACVLCAYVSAVRVCVRVYMRVA